MYSKKLKLFVTGLLILLLASTQLSAAASGKITGKVISKDDGEPLFAANVFLLGTAIGAATDIYGNYEIKGIPAGTYILKVSYLGLEEELRTVEVTEGQVQTQNFELGLATIEGETVIITAQAAGQKSAINQQLTAKSIMSVVSSERIQELPDANAAETVGRLPGVSIQRDGGEGNKLVIRGLEPKYNAIMIGGVRLSSTNASDRSVDLSMISPYMLDGIEVSKNVTADMDADVLGGSVNFKIKKAGGQQQKEEIAVNLLSQGGYTGLSNAYNQFNNYKYVASAEARFFDGKFGVFIMGDVERKNLTSNEMGMVARNYNNIHDKYYIATLETQNIPRDRSRLNSSLVLDYDIPNGSISLLNSYTSGKTDVSVRSETFDVDANQHLHTMRYSGIERDLLLNTLGYEQDFEHFSIDASLSHTFSTTENPDYYDFDFREFNAFNNNGDFKRQPNLDPRTIPGDMRNDFSTTLLEFLETGSDKYEDRTYSAALNLKKMFTLSKYVSAEVKIGGKYKNQTKTYDEERLNGAGVSLASSTAIRELINDQFGSLSINSFLNPNYDYGDFLDNEFAMVAPLNEALMSQLAQILRDNQQQIADGGSAITYSRNNYESKTNDFSGEENQTAFYAMATVDIGDNLNIIGGFRYQNLETEYTAARGLQQTETQRPYTHYDTTATNSHEHWLPSFIVKYKPFEWFDVRAAYTNTLSYPDFISIIPRIDENGLGGTIEWNDINLKPTTSENIDLYFSFKDNKVGLFTIGGFYKKIADQIYPFTFFPKRSETANYFPAQYYDPAYPPTKTYQVSTYINNDNEATVWGIELDWQTHFWYLPEPFNGIVMNVNYTHIESKTQYSFEALVSRFPPTYETHSFEDRLLFQPNDIINVSLGYDYKDFSIRASVLYKDNVFSSVEFYEGLRASTLAYTRYDVSVKQKLPWYGLQVFGVFSNIGSEKDVSALQMYNNIPTAMESYGMSANFGFRWSM